MNRTEHGRSLLRRWENGKPENFYEDDRYLRAALVRRLGAERIARAEPALRQAGADSATVVSRAAALVDQSPHLPRLERWDGIGERTEAVVFHPAHDEIGRRVWRSGVLAVLGEPGNVTLHAALAYLFAMNGEVPHLCAITCTAGLIKAIQRAGDDRMRAEWLPRLLDRDYDRRWHGAQFLTEVQGGSDVGANACTARPVPGEPGLWRITGEKWFCSNVTADLYAVSARPDGAAEGTSGLGLFVVPRHLDDGRPNGIYTRRLKNKLGTRTLPTAELDLVDALGWPLGRLEDGFKLMMGAVINTSRLGVAIGSSGIMRRAFVEASHYARARTAFGRRLVDFPAVRQQLAEMRVLGVAGLAFTLAVAAHEDRLTLDGVLPEDDALFRTGVNLAKYVCSSDGGPVVHHAIEILGGNGTIEDLSPLPRLYREMPVQESWEGPHNTLMAQILRDAFRGKFHDALLDAAQARLYAAERPELAATRDAALAGLDDVRGRVGRLLHRGPEAAALHARAVVHRMARVFQAAVVLEEAQDELARGQASGLDAIAEFLVKRYVTPGYDPMEDDTYPGLVDRIVGA